MDERLAAVQALIQAEALPTDCDRRMARYVIERDFGRIGEDEMQKVAARSKLTGAEH